MNVDLVCNDVQEFSLSTSDEEVDRLWREIYSPGMDGKSLYEAATKLWFKNYLAIPYRGDPIGHPGPIGRPGAGYEEPENREKMLFQSAIHTLEEIVKMKRHFQVAT